VPVKKDEERRPVTAAEGGRRGPGRRHVRRRGAACALPRLALGTTQLGDPHPAAAVKAIRSGEVAELERLRVADLEGGAVFEAPLAAVGYGVGEVATTRRATCLASASTGWRPTTTTAYDARETEQRALRPRVLGFSQPPARIDIHSSPAKYPVKSKTRHI
jgi:hypothetical protein